MMYFNVLYHFYMPHRRIIFAKAATGVAERNKGKADRARTGGFPEVAYISYVVKPRSFQ
jgi:cbb3-type cytochrome oxidase subunit 3